MVCDSSGRNIVGYIPLLPGKPLLENIFSIYEKRDFATMVVLYISPSIIKSLPSRSVRRPKFREKFLGKLDKILQNI